jgi:hypothetical protein
MSKNKLGTGKRKGAIARPNTSHTSPRAILMKQRMATAIDYRLQGHAYWRIAKAMGCDASTVHNYVVKALKEMIPPDSAQQVLRLELARLDAMQAAIFSSANAGDIPAIDATLRIMAQRARLLGLNADKPNNSLNLNIGGNRSGLDARECGIQVTFVRSRERIREEKEKLLGPKLIEGRTLLPLPDAED